MVLQPPDMRHITQQRAAIALIVNQRVAVFPQSFASYVDSEQLHSLKP
jgi:hypothetical protein